MSSRSAPMLAPWPSAVIQNHTNATRNSSTSLDGQTWSLLNTFAGDGRKSPMNTFIGFERTDIAPPGQPQSQDWMRVPYTDPKDAMPVEFHEVQSASCKGAACTAGRVYKLRAHWPAVNPTHTGWVTFAEDNSHAQWFHANGAEADAALVRVEPSGKPSEFVLVNLGKASQRSPPPPSPTSYISFCDAGEWVRCNGYTRKLAITIKLLKPNTPAPPTPAPAPPAPPAPTPCPTKFDFRRLGEGVGGKQNNQGRRFFLRTWKYFCVLREYPIWILPCAKPIVVSLGPGTYMTLLNDRF